MARKCSGARERVLRQVDAAADGDDELVQRVDDAWVSVANGNVERDRRCPRSGNDSSPSPSVAAVLDHAEEGRAAELA